MPQIDPAGRLDTWTYEDRQQYQQQQADKVKQLANDLIPSVITGNFAQVKQQLADATQALTGPKPDPLLQQVGNNLKAKWEQTGPPQQPSDRYGLDFNYRINTPPPVTSSSDTGLAAKLRAGQVGFENGQRGTYDNEGNFQPIEKVQTPSFADELKKGVNNLLHSPVVSGNTLIRDVTGLNPENLPGPLPQVTDVVASPLNLIGVGEGRAAGAGFGAALKLGVRNLLRNEAAGLGGLAAQGAANKGLDTAGITNPAVRTAVGLGAGLAGGVAGFEAASHPQAALRGLERTTGAVGDVAARTGVVPDGAVPFGGMVKSPDVPAGGVEAPRIEPVSDTGAPPPTDMPATSEGGAASPPNGGGKEPPNAGAIPPGSEPVGKLIKDGPLILPELKPQQLGKLDVAMNAVKRTLLVPQRQEDTVATPVMRWRQRAADMVQSQAARVGTVAQKVVNDAFETDAKGRITSLPGSPTIQDVAARLPTYEPYMDAKQLAAVQKLHELVGGYNDLFQRVGVDIGSRPDVQPGGFYLPRGRADVEGADAPKKIGTGSGKRGAKIGAEKHAVFDSMAQGIDAGYQYAPVGEAMQSYARDAGNRIIDQHTANYFKTVTDEEGNLLGQTPRARLLEQNPGITAKVEGLRKSLTSLKATGVRLTDRQQAAIEDFLNNPAPDLDALRDNLDVRVGANAVGKQGVNFGKNPREIRAAQRDVQNQIKALMPEWHTALEKARQMPRDQQGIGFYQLQGTSFPDSVANAANRYLNAEKPPTGKGTVALHVVEATNHLLRGIRATADVSFMGIQGLLGAAHDPAGYGKAMVTAYRSIADPEALAAFIQKFDREASARGGLTSEQYVAHGLHLGGASSEFAIGTGDIFRAAGEKVSHLPVIEQANRSFGYFGDALRLDLAQQAVRNAERAGLDVRDPGVLNKIMDSANRATGWSPSRFGGDLGELGMFAPRFFQSQMETIAKAATSGSIDGMEARRELLKLIGAGTLLTVAANEALGEPISWKQEFTPGGSNFMRIRVAGNDISLFGPWDSLVRGIAAMGHGDFKYIARSKASPAVGALWDLTTGQTFMGDKASLSSPGYVLRDLIAPFSLSNVGREGPLTTAVGLTGLKASPMTPNEQLDRVSQAKFGHGYYDLSPSQQRIIQQQYPDIWQRKIENASAATQKYYAVKNQLMTEQQGRDNDLLTGKISLQQWQAAAHDAQTKLSQAGADMFGSQNRAPKNAADRYYQQVEANTVNGITDWTKVDAWKAAQPIADQRFIDENTAINATPLQKLRSTLLRAYYNIPKYKGIPNVLADQVDQAYQDIANVAGSTDNARMLQAMNQPQFAKMKPIVRDLVRRKITGLLTETGARANYAKQHPDFALVYGSGKLSPEMLGAIRADLKVIANQKP